MSEVLLLSILRKLEIELHQLPVRQDTNRLSELLHPSFSEIGRSGRMLLRDDILKDLPLETMAGTLWSQDYGIQIISDELALLTYLSAHESESGALSMYTSRSSLWQMSRGRWQLRFHQGTAIDEFAKADT